MDRVQVHQLLLNIGTFEKVTESSSPVLKGKNLDSGFLVDDIINGIPIEIIIGFEDSFPLSPPVFFIKNYDDFKYIPHVEPDGKICYTHEDYLFLDRNKPGQIITETYELVKSIIVKGLNGENLIDFVNEFESYWNRIKGHESILCNIEVRTEPCILKIGVKEKFVIAVSDNNDNLQSIARFINLKDSGVTYKNGLFIPLNPTELFLPPRYNDHIDINFIKRILENNTSSAIQNQIQKLLPKSSASGYIIFSFLQPNGNEALFGVRFSKSNAAESPLIVKDYSGKVIPVELQRLDQGYLYRRGGTGENVSKKKGLIVGCGSVGGFIIEELVRNGFMNLTIVDPDILTPENCYRHLLGFTAINKNKALAIKEKIEHYFPHSNIEPLQEKIEELVDKKRIDFNSYDFIVVATGNVTINCYLNDLFYKNFPGKPVIFVWNEPYGIGGHCIITNISNCGCYRCLYGEDNSFNSASFADRYQPKPFLKSISGCGSVYTPYGALDSMRTCVLTVTKIIDTLKGKELTNAIFSWKGTGETFLDEGFKLSPRFYMSDTDLEMNKSNFLYSECPTCAKSLN